MHKKCLLVHQWRIWKVGCNSASLTPWLHKSSRCIVPWTSKVLSTWTAWPERWRMWRAFKSLKPLAGVITSIILSQSSFAGTADKGHTSVSFWANGSWFYPLRSNWGPCRFHSINEEVSEKLEKYLGMKDEHLLTILMAACCKELDLKDLFHWDQKNSTFNFSKHQLDETGRKRGVVMHISKKQSWHTAWNKIEVTKLPNTWSSANVHGWAHCISAARTMVLQIDVTLEA